MCDHVSKSKKLHVHSCTLCTPSGPSADEGGRLGFPLKPSHTLWYTLRPSANKARVGGVSPRCGIEQIRVGGSKGRPYPSQSEQYLIRERFVPPTIVFFFFLLFFFFFCKRVVLFVVSASAGDDFRDGMKLRENLVVVET